MKRTRRMLGSRAENRTSAKLISAVVACGISTVARSEVNVSGYFDTDYVSKTSNVGTDKESRKDWFDQHHLSIFLQQETGIYKFFTEIEFEHDAKFGAKTLTTDPNVIEDGDTTSKAHTHDVEGTASRGEVKVEAAWVNMNFHRNFNVRIGRLLAPTLWPTNHYPHLVKSFYRPSIIKKIVPFDGTGMMIHGEIAGPAFYQLMSTKYKGETSDNGFTNLARIGANFNIGEGSLSVAASTVRKYNDEESRMNYEVNFELHNVTFWTEIGEQKDNAKGYYAVVSYDLDLAGQTLSPYVLLDSFTQNLGSDSEKVTSSKAYGINLNPIPFAVLKVEQHTQTAKPKTGDSKKTQSYNVTFAYFFL